MLDLTNVTVEELNTISIDAAIKNGYGILDPNTYIEKDGILIFIMDTKIGGMIFLTALQVWRWIQLTELFRAKYRKDNNAYTVIASPFNDNLNHLLFKFNSGASYTIVSLAALIPIPIKK